MKPKIKKVKGPSEDEDDEDSDQFIDMNRKEGDQQSVKSPPTMRHSSTFNFSKLTEDYKAQDKTAMSPSTNQLRH